MIKIETAHLPALHPLLLECVKEANIGEFFNADDAMNWAHTGIENGDAVTYVDDPFDPKYFVCMLVNGPSTFPREKPLWVMLVYCKPEHRGGTAFARLSRMIEAEATIRGRNVIYASSWCYGNTPDLSSVWEGLGYTKREIVFAKTL